MPTPRPYLSYSQIITFERSPEEYKKVYLQGIRRHSKEMDFGSIMAEGMEAEEDTGNFEIDYLRMAMPRPEIKEHWIDVVFEGIPLRARLDGLTLNPLIIDENKTGKTKWTQKMVDSHGQIDFYWLTVWKKYGWPEYARLNHAETRNSENGGIELTGKIQTFKTTRTLSDIMLYYRRHIRPAWDGIQKICEQELNKLT